jgi:hypothetical protein
MGFPAMSVVGRNLPVQVNTGAVPLTAVPGPVAPALPRWFSACAMHRQTPA